MSTSFCISVRLLPQRSDRYSAFSCESVQPLFCAFFAAIAAVIAAGRNCILHTIPHFSTVWISFLVFAFGFMSSISRPVWQITITVVSGSSSISLRSSLWLSLSIASASRSMSFTHLCSAKKGKLSVKSDRECGSGAPRSLRKFIPSDCSQPAVLIILSAYMLARNVSSPQYTCRSFPAFSSALRVFSGVSLNTGPFAITPSQRTASCRRECGSAGGVPSVRRPRRCC